MSGFTRLTIVGRTRKAEIVVPGDETIAALIPQLMDLLEERTGSVARPLTLVRATGQQLDTALTLAEQHVSAGELLRLLRVDEAPAPPEVADVTDVVAEARDDKRGLWTARHREGVGAVAIATMMAVAALLFTGSYTGTVALLTAVFAGSLLVSVVLGRLHQRWPATAFAAAALGIVPATGASLADAGLGSREDPVIATLVLALGLGWLAIGVALGLGLGIRPALRASVVGVALSVLPVLLHLMGLAELETAAVVGVAAAVICGMLPWYAMNSSGLTGIDDLVIAGRLTNRETVLATVNDAYRSLTWSTVAVALPLLIAASLLAASADGWAIGLGAALIVVTALRTRAFPLAGQAIVLWAASIAAFIVAAVAHTDEWYVLAALVIVCVATLLVVALNPPAHTRARLRRAGNSIEMFAVVALLPVTLGVFGVYPDLLGTF
ncbi:EsaB/YukD family protein [Cryobacterium sp. SO2]|uniref:EsaB/YukD family protein n=1 Tax=Cryobacterium sp. SO2 TaxID=1897060 RepID=UPI00223DF75F|nr:EsaB/YukD family protein [Cryobacterium sp. SO2]WEO77908.1 EsaB/YukD family protein [Cryobacterium sp. SO2]